MHLGGISTMNGSNTSWQWQTSPSAIITGPDTQGTFPQTDGYGTASGAGVWASGQNIITAYNGQGMTYSNVFTHYWSDGLLVSEFGQENENPFTNNPQPGYTANARYFMVPGPNGDLYMFGTDESQHSGLSVWRVSGLDTIHEMSASGTLGGSTISLTDSSGSAGQLAR